MITKYIIFTTFFHTHYNIFFCLPPVHHKSRSWITVGPVILKIVSCLFFFWQAIITTGTVVSAVGRKKDLLENVNASQSPKFTSFTLAFVACPSVNPLITRTPFSSVFVWQWSVSSHSFYLSVVTKNGTFVLHISALTKMEGNRRKNTPQNISVERRPPSFQILLSQLDCLNTLCLLVLACFPRICFSDLQNLMKCL